MVLLVIHVLLSLWIAQSLGEKRRIGGGWALFFCLTLSILIGLLIVVFSPPKGNKAANDKPSSSQVTYSLLAAAIGLLMVIGTVRMLISPDYTTVQVAAIVTLTIGILGAAIYISYPNAFCVSKSS